MERLTKDFITPGSARSVPRATPGSAGTAVGLAGKFRNWRRKVHAIRDLQRLDDRLLADIGLSRGAIQPAVEGLVTAEQATGPAANDNPVAMAA